MASTTWARLPRSTTAMSPRFQLGRDSVYPAVSVGRSPTGSPTSTRRWISAHRHRRAQPARPTRRLQDRISETAASYAMHWPFQPVQVGSRRALRRYAIGSAPARWARPPVGNAPTGMPTAGPRVRVPYGKQNWHDNMVESAGVREAVGLFDQTSFAKARVEGPGALPCSATSRSPISTPRSTRPSTHSGAITRAVSRPTSPSPARATTPSSSSRRQPPRTGTSRAGCGERQAARTSRSPTSPTTSRCSG